jgi:class 3 adenylate cyclase/tetratricopeptide (TPR) repeat protein
VTEEAGVWDAYVPRMAVNWVTRSPESNWRSVEGSLVFVDISGFTSLSERLASRGRIGAEELTGVLNRVFARMLETAFVRGGFLLKFGGDALLLFFEGEDHILQACAAVVEMRRALRDASKEQTSVGRINLKMSSGVHTGHVDFFLVGDSHKELVVTGPAATVTTEMEGSADAGEIVVSDAVAARAPADFVGAAKGTGWLLRKREIAHPPAGRPPGFDAQVGDLSQLVPKGLRDHLGSGSVEPEHRLATIGFLKFKGVDALLRGEGAESTSVELDRLFRHVQEAIDAEGVSYLASDIDADGGKIILATGVPRSQHDDEGRMLRALRRIVDGELALQLRAGANRGHVFAGNIGTPFRSTYTVMGDTVNLAARLMAVAKPGELYAAPSVLNLSSTLFETTALPPFEVKGKSQPVHAFAVGEESGVRPPVLTAVLPFQGREAETEMLVGVVNTCSRMGRGGMMTVTGDTGVGKSRLVAEALARCDGMDTLLIQAEPNGSENPYWAFRDPLRRFLDVERGSNDDMARRLARAVDDMAPDLSWALPLLGRVLHIDIADNERTAAIDGRFRPQQTAEALVALLSSGYTRPVAMVAEDGQWLDEASTALLEMIGEAARERPWTVLITARNNSSDFSPLGDEIELGPLSDDSVRDITIESTRATPLRSHELASIVSRAGGNPLFLNEILRVVAETGTAAELPESLDAVVSTEIDTLPPLPRRLLRYSSVLGRRFRRQVLDEFLAPEDVALDDATRQELERFIEEDAEGRVTFRHSVVHEIAYASLPFATRRELHGRAGRVIESQSRDDIDSVAEYLAAHFSLSGNPDKAFRYSILAAGRARDAYANTDAALQYQRALSAARQLGEPQKHEVADIWVALGEVRELAGHMEESREAYSRALASAVDDPVRKADICLRRAGTWMSSGNLTQAMRFVSMGQRALENQSSLSHEGLLARLVAFESSVFMLKNAPSQARRSALRAGDLARTSEEDEALARSYAVLDWANFMLDIDEPRHGPEAIETYQRLGLLERSVGVMNNMGAFAYLEGRWDEAIDWYQQSLEAAERSGNVLEAALTKANIAEVLIGQRKHELASPLLAEARRTYEASRSDYYLPLVALLEGRASTAGGHFADAVTVLERLASQPGGAATPWIEEIEIALAEALLRSGEAEAALDRLSAADKGAIADSAPGALRVRGMALDTLGQLEQARATLQGALEAADDRADQLEEALTREALHETEGRLGLAPEPASVDRLAELSAALGLVTPQMASRLLSPGREAGIFEPDGLVRDLDITV